MAIETVNPATGQRVRTFEADGTAAIEAKLALAQTAFGDWSRRPVAERTAVVRRAAEQEAEKCAAGCRYYAEHGAEFLRPELVAESPGGRDEIAFQPLGAVLA